MSQWIVMIDHYIDDRQVQQARRELTRRHRFFMFCWIAGWIAAITLVILLGQT